MSAHDSVPDSRVVMDVGEGQTTQDAGSWSIRRALSGGGLPGQARAVSGSSVGSGQVQIVSPAGRSPWTPGPVRPGGRVRVEARADVDRPWSSVAQMTARSVSGTARSQALDVDVEDDLGGLLTQTALLDVYTPSPSVGTGAYLFDVAHVVESAARAGGIGSSSPLPPPGFTSHLIAPCVGSLQPVVGKLDAWTLPVPLERDGQACFRTGRSWLAQGRPRPVIQVSIRVYNVPGDSSLAAVTVFGYAGILYMSPGNGSVSVDATHTSTHTTVGYVNMPQAAVAGWNLYEARIDTRGAQWTLSARLNGGAWASAPCAPLTPRQEDSPFFAKVDVTDVGGDPTPTFDVRVMSSDTPIEDVVPVTPRAVVGLLGSVVPAVAEAGSAGSWDVIQDVVRATLGAAWIDEGGRLIVRGRDRLRSGLPAETVVAEETLEDVPWSIGVDDVADRVEVRFSPMVETVATSTTAPTVWESTATVMVRAGATVSVAAEFDSPVGMTPIGWAAVYAAGPMADRSSLWNAFPNSDGTGAEPPMYALEVSTEHISSRRAVIRIRNATASTLYVTRLTMRAAAVARAGEVQIASSGVPESQARAPFTLDCGAWVQDEATAQEILQWLAGTLSQPLPVLTGVRVVPDMARRLGSIVTVRDTTTALTAKAIITGIDTSHSPGSLEQRLDLTILSTTFDDVDTWLTREGLNTFDALDARITALGIDTFDKLDDFLSRLGGTL